MEIVTEQWPDMIKAKPKLKEVQATKVTEASIKEMFSIVLDYAFENRLVFIQMYAPFGYPETFVFRKKTQTELLQAIFPI